MQTEREWNSLLKFIAFCLSFEDASDFCFVYLNPDRVSERTDEIGKDGGRKVSSSKDTKILYRFPALLSVFSRIFILYFFHVQTRSKYLPFRGSFPDANKPNLIRWICMMLGETSSPRQIRIPMKPSAISERIRARPNPRRASLNFLFYAEIIIRRCKSFSRKRNLFAYSNE